MGGGDTNETCRATAPALVGTCGRGADEAAVGVADAVPTAPTGFACGGGLAPPPRDATCAAAFFSAEAAASAAGIPGVGSAAAAAKLLLRERVTGVPFADAAASAAAAA